MAIPIITSKEITSKHSMPVITVSATKTGNTGVVDTEYWLDAPTLLTPSDNRQILMNNVLLTWSPVSGATGYVILLSTDPNFSADSLLRYETTATSFAVTGLRLGNSTVRVTYYWKVVAFSDKAFSDWSTVWSFTNVNPNDGITPPNDDGITDDSLIDDSIVDPNVTVVDNDDNQVNPLLSIKAFRCSKSAIAINGTATLTVNVVNSFPIYRYSYSVSSGEGTISLSGMQAGPNLTSSVVLTAPATSQTIEVSFYVEDVTGLSTRKTLSIRIVDNEDQEDDTDVVDGDDTGVTDAKNILTIEDFSIPDALKLGESGTCSVVVKLTNSSYRIASYTWSILTDGTALEVGSFGDPTNRATTYLAPIVSGEIDVMIIVKDNAPTPNYVSKQGTIRILSNTDFPTDSDSASDTVDLIVTSCDKNPDNVTLSNTMTEGQDPALAGTSMSAVDSGDIYRKGSVYIDSSFGRILLGDSSQDTYLVFYLSGINPIVKIPQHKRGSKLAMRLQQYSMITGEPTGVSTITHRVFDTFYGEAVDVNADLALSLPAQIAVNGEVEWHLAASINLDISGISATDIKNSEMFFNVKYALEKLDRYSGFAETKIVIDDTTYVGSKLAQKGVMPDGINTNAIDITGKSSLVMNLYVRVSNTNSSAVVTDVEVAVRYLKVNCWKEGEITVPLGTESWEWDSATKTWIPYLFRVEFRHAQDNSSDASWIATNFTATQREANPNMNSIYRDAEIGDHGFVGIRSFGFTQVLKKSITIDTEAEWDVSGHTSSGITIDASGYISGSLGNSVSSAVYSITGWLESYARSEVSPSESNWADNFSSFMEDTFDDTGRVADVPDDAEYGIGQSAFFDDDPYIGRSAIIYKNYIDLSGQSLIGDLTFKLYIKKVSNIYYDIDNGDTIGFVIAGLDQSETVIDFSTIADISDLIPTGSFHAGSKTIPDDEEVSDDGSYDVMYTITIPAVDVESILDPDGKFWFLLYSSDTKSDYKIVVGHTYAVTSDENQIDVGGDTFNLSVDALEYGTVVIDPLYAANATITHDGAGVLSPLTIAAGDWASGEVTKAMTYTVVNPEILKVTVTEDGNSAVTGFTSIVVGESASVVAADVWASSSKLLNVSRYGKGDSGNIPLDWETARTDWTSGPDYGNEIGNAFGRAYGFYHGIFFYTGTQTDYTTSFVVCKFDVSSLSAGDLVVRLRTNWKLTADYDFCQARLGGVFSSIANNHTITASYFNWNNAWNPFNSADVDYDDINAGKVSANFSSLMSAYSYNDYIYINLGITKDDVVGYGRLAVVVEASQYNYSYTGNWQDYYHAHPQFENSPVLYSY